MKKPDLIQINTDPDGLKTVNARDLHEFLEVKSEFRNWIKNRIEHYCFTQDIDFIAGNFLPGSERLDYYISIDMAKELSMVERNEKGKQARQYFIECEKRVNRALPQTYKEALIELVSQVEENEELAMKLTEAEPKIEFHDKVGDAEGLLSIGITAKMLGYGRNNFFKELRKEKIFFRTEPYQSFINRGYFEVKTTESNGHIQKQAFTTPTGLIWLQKRF